MNIMTQNGENMNYISKKIVEWRKQILVLFLVMMAVFGISIFNLSVNYNMMDYLPESANSTVAINTMKKSFNESLANTNVMVSDVTIAQALEYKEKLEKTSGVTDVMWLDDVVDLKVPIQTLDEDTVKTYYNKKNALFSVTIADGKEKSTVNELYKIVGDTGAITGNSVSQARSQNMAMSQTIRSAMILGPLIILILIVSTTSWIEPFMYLMTIGAAIVINLGLCAWTGEISYVTMAVGPILQLAVSLDYAVFLSHSFEKNRKENDNIYEAMKVSLKESFASIFASAATTLFGFVALLFMNFKIGPDMGIVLARGVVLSFLSVLLFLPALLLCVCKLLDKTRHRSFMPNFKKTGGFLIRTRIPLFLMIIILIVPCYLAQKNNSFMYGSGEAAATSRIGQDEKKIDKVFESTNTLVMLVPRGDSTSEMLLGNELKELNHVKCIASYAESVSNKIPSEYLDKSITKNFYSEDYARIIINTDTEAEGDVAFTTVKQIRNLASKYYDKKDVLLCGESANMYDMMECVKSDNKKVDLITIIAIFIVLLIEFKSVLLPVVLIATIKTAIWINMSFPYFSGDQMSYIGYMVVSTVMMGATIDYAILLTDHYMVNRKEMPALEAMKYTISTSIKSMLVSSMTMAIAGFSLGIISGEEIVKVLGILLGRGSVIALVLSVTFLPAFILLVDKLIPYTTWNTGFFRKEDKKRMIKQGGLEDNAGENI